MGILGVLCLLMVLIVLTKASTVCMPEENIWRNVRCNEHFTPYNCDFDKIPLVTVEDYDRCGPAFLPLPARNLYLGVAGRGFTNKANRDAFNRINIIPKVMRDITDNSLEISTLNQEVAIPIGMSPTALQKLAHPDGEIATVAAAVKAKTVMILSSYSSTLLEDVAKVAHGSKAHLWMQVYIFNNRNYTINIVRKAERHGFEAIVLTVDSNIEAKVTCDAKLHPDIGRIPIPNIPGTKWEDELFEIMTFNDIKWLKSITRLPIIAKGILRGEDARMAIEHGASAILVSNHGGRQMDYAPATIDALPEVVRAVRKMHPIRDVYLDGGVRNGYDVYKAIARGAKMVFVGRPVLWGLALKGAKGVEDVLNILTREFNETMLISGASNPSEIHEDTISPRQPLFM